MSLLLVALTLSALAQWLFFGVLALAWLLLFAGLVRLREDLDQTNNDVKYVAAWVFANEDDDGPDLKCGCEDCLEEWDQRYAAVINGDPTLRGLSRHGWLLTNGADDD